MTFNPRLGLLRAINRTPLLLTVTAFGLACVSWYVPGMM